MIKLDYKIEIISFVNFKILLLNELILIEYCAGEIIENPSFYSLVPETITYII